MLEYKPFPKEFYMKPMHYVDQINHDKGSSKSTGIESTFGPLMGRVPQPIAINPQLRRLLGTAALALLKMLESA